MSNRWSKISFALFFCLACASILYFYFLHSQELSFVQDDAFIYLRYVKNFFKGNGLVFNRGEFVEGYTSFLWLLLLIAGKLAGVKLVWFIQAFSRFWGAAVILLLPIAAYDVLEQNNFKNHALPKLLSLLPSFVLAFTAGFVYWTSSGMETALFVFLFLVTFHLKAKQKQSYLFPAILLALARPEGILLVLILMLSDLAFGKLNNRDFNLKKFGAEFIVFTLPVLIHFLFRLYYYGDVFPNTFYAKTGFSGFYLARGIKYFLDFWGSPFAIVFFAFPTIYVGVKYFRKRWAFFSVNVVVVYSVYIIFVGGDVLPSIRFFLPILPLLQLNLAKMAADICLVIIEKSGVKIGKALILLTFALVVFAVAKNFSRENLILQKWRAYERGLVYKMKLYAGWINKVQAEKGKELTVALSTIGAFSYYSNCKTLDIIGLTDSYIARHPKEVKGIAGKVAVKWKERHYNADYVLKRKPDFVIFPAGAKPASYPEVALFSRKQFQRNYYLTLFYSNKFYELLPVFKLIPDSLKNSVKQTEQPCDVQYVEDYLQANNCFLSFLRSGNGEQLKTIEKYCRKLIDDCPAQQYLAFNVLGYSAFHSGKLKAALNYFKKALKLNKLNSIALVYLVNIYRKLKMRKELNAAVLRLKKIAPDVYPNLIIAK